MAQKYAFFDEAQMAAESGGRQFDQSGKTLVGRYPDGSTPKGDKKAYGAGQMQVGTARNTAKQFGIAWDEKKFMSDPEYNLTLANKHKEYLTQKYGDKSIADAAYHQGEPTVDKAIQQYGRSGYLQGIGPEGKKYVKKIAAARGGKGSSMAGNQDFFAGLESALAPEVAASQNVKSNAGAIFGSDARITEEVAGVREQNDRQRQALGVLDATQEVAQQVQMRSKIEQIDESRQVSDQITSATRELQARTKPVFEARKRVTDQLYEIATMNPLERGIRGLFDYNYDQGYMEDQLGRLDVALKSDAADFEYVNRLNAVALGEIDRRYGLNTAETDLLAKQSAEDLTLVGMQLANAGNFLNATQEEINTQASVISAKLNASRDMLGRIDGVTTTDLMNQAAENGGVIEYNGVELSYAQLRDTRKQQEQQEWAVESYKMGIASGRMDFAEKSADNVMQYASRAQLEGWINNGGIATLPDGTEIQLPQDKLTHYLGIHMSRENAMAEEVANNIPGAQAVVMASNSIKADAQLFQRGQGFFKKGSQDDLAMTQIFKNHTSSLAALVEAKNAGKPAATIRALTEKVFQNSQQMRAQMDQTILRTVGGDKQSAQYVSSFVYGTPLSDGDSASALVHFAIKGGIPDAMKASPEAKQLFAAALKVVAENRTDSKGKPLSEAALKQLVTDRVLSTARRTVGQARFDRVFTGLPSEAAKDGNAFGRLSQEQWGTLRVNAENLAAKAVASQLGIDAGQVLKMARTGKPLSSAPAHVQIFQRFNEQFADSYNQTEQTQIVEGLDDLPAVSPGMTNSEAMVEYLRSGKLQNRAGMNSQHANTGAFGDYILGPVVGNALESSISEYATLVQDSAEVVYGGRRETARVFDNSYAKNPVARGFHILMSVPGVGEAGAKALLPFLRQQENKPVMLATTVGAYVMPRGINTRSFVRSQEDIFYNALSSTKFEDPQLEGYRKRAVAGFRESATESGGAVENFLYSLKSIGGE